MKKIAVATALSASALGMSTGMSFADYTLNILHINDWHSRIESNNKYESTCSAEEETKGECFGGAARLVTAIAAERKKLEGQNVLLLNGGDNFQGSLFYTTYKGRTEAEFLNQMKFDAMTVGNHEFDDGEDALAPFLDVIRFPVLSANVKASAAAKVGDRIKPSVVIELGGQKIGIIGAVTNDTPDLATPGPNITIEDDVKTITAEVEKLKGQGVNKIIALTHVGYPRDKEMIARIPGIDVVVGGHSHSLLSNTDPKAEGPYPTMIDNPDGYKVPVTQAASYSKLLGEFKVVFDDNGVVKEASGNPIPLDKSVTPDPQVLARIKELGAPIEELKAKQVGETTAAIDGSRESCRTRECAMGNLVSDAVLDRVKGQGVEIVFTNGGGLRASIDQGKVSMGEVLTVLPFQNTVATFKILGKTVVGALEHGVSGVEEGKGQFPQVAGLKYSFDRSAPANAGRIKSVEVMEGGQWKPIDLAKEYIVATNNYVRQGGDGYKLFIDGKDAYDYGPSLEQVVADYVGAHSPYTPKLEGRITEVGATQPAKPADAAQGGTSAPEAAPAVPAPPAASNDIANTPPAVEAPAAKPGEAAPAEAAKPADAATPVRAGGTHTIVKGDTYWDIAVKAYGDGTKWRRIAHANPGQEPHRLLVGSELKIPAK
ncbi:5'-nucleotidase C-terminal domain-containing protein [Mesorhizobium sp. UC74_2]|uniref:5'-nucleotidase C-terminal domain-containing protein n=1 Tax=Mesorhizobium sp. UC74_2 TaxID=3350171 RepID=UPI00366FBB06